MPSPYRAGAGHIQLPTEVAEIVRQVAAEEDRSYTQVVIRAVRAYAALAATNAVR